MNWSDLWLKARALLARKRVERELQDEVNFHIEMQIRKNVQLGMTADEARRQALLKFGSEVRVKEECRDARGLTLIDQTRQDLMYARRSFAKQPIFTLVAIVTIALGIGASTAIFSVVNAVVVRPLPYKDSERIMRVVETQLGPTPPGVPQRLTTMRMDDFEKWRQRTNTFSQMALYQNPQPVTFDLNGEPIRLIGSSVSPAIFALLGIGPLFGQVFTEADEKPDSDGIILSYSAWLKYFSGKSDVVGRRVKMTEAGSSTIVGVMPPGFEFPDAQTEFWDPSALRPGSRNRENILARTKAGIPIEQATIEANRIFQELREEEKQASPAIAGSAVRVDLVRLKDDLVEPVRPALLVLAASVGFLLLISSANVGNLLLVRAAGRQQEIALRAALGAGRSRLVRQLLTENAVLAATGGVIGSTIAFSVIRFVPILAPKDIPRLNEITIDTTVLLFAVALTLVTGILFGVAPALRMLRFRDSSTLRQGAGPAFAGLDLFRGNRIRSSLAVIEIAMAMVLLIAAGLLINSFLKLLGVDPGYEAANVLTFQVPLSPNRYPIPRYKAFNDELLSRLKTFPEVNSAGFSTMMPLQPFGIRLTLRFDGLPKPATDNQPVAYLHAISPDYLKAMGIKLIAGRVLTEYDREGQPQVALVNKTLAQRYFPNTNPLEKRASQWQIVGIVDDVRHTGLDAAPLPEVYVNASQMNLRVFPGMYFAIRTTGQPTKIIPNIREAIRQLDPLLTLDNINTMEERLWGSVARPRFYAAIVGLFAVIAVTLAATGISGIIAYSVSQSTREIGIRMTLGAEPRKVVALVLGQGILLSSIGIALGLAGAAAVTHYLNKLLYGLTPLDASTFFGAAAIFMFIALLSAYFPARRATRIDPLVALRHE